MIRPTVTGAAVTLSVTYPWRWAERLDAGLSVTFVHTVWPEPTAIAVTLRRCAGLETLSVYRCAGTANWKEPEPSELPSNVHGRSDASIRTEAPTTGKPETESVTKPRTRPSGPEAVAGTTETSSRTKTAKRTKGTDTGARVAGTSMQTPAERKTAESRRRNRVRLRALGPLSRLRPTQPNRADAGSLGPAKRQMRPPWLGRHGHRRIGSPNRPGYRCEPRFGARDVESTPRARIPRHPDEPQGERRNRSGPEARSGWQGCGVPPARRHGPPEHLGPRGRPSRPRPATGRAREQCGDRLLGRRSTPIDPNHRDELLRIPGRHGCPPSVHPARRPHRHGVERARGTVVPQP